MVHSRPDEADASKSEQGRSETPKKQGTATKLAIFTRTVVATLILAAAGGIGAGVGQLVIPSKRPGTPTATASAPGTRTPAPALAPTSSGAPAQNGTFSVQLGTQQSFVSVPDSSNSQDLNMVKCISGNVLFSCDYLETAPSEDIYNNQQWHISASQLGSNGVYVATIISKFSGNWAFYDGTSDQENQYLSDLNANSGPAVGLVPVSGDLNTLNPTGHQGQYWILRPETGGQWEISPWLTPEQCLSSPGGSTLEFQTCQSNDASDQLWTIGLSRPAIAGPAG